MKEQVKFHQMVYRKFTSAIKMAIADLNGINNKISDVFSFHTPNAKSHFRHLEAIVECYSHFLYRLLLFTAYPVTLYPFAYFCTFKDAHSLSVCDLRIRIL